VTPPRTHSNPANTVFDTKRLIGRKMDEADLKKDMKHWPFSVVDKGGKPSISVGFKGEKREFVRRILVCRRCYDLTLPLQ
jgi:molecular chaperone DnaK (HSP70)